MIDKKDTFRKLTIHIPNSVYTILKKVSVEKKQAMSRLAACLIDTELGRDKETRFNYYCEMPTNEFVAYAYTNEAAKVARFLETFGRGTSIETLVLCRREIGIHDTDTLLAGLRELLERKIVIKVPIHPLTRKKFNYDEDQMFYKIIKLGNRPSAKDIERRKLNAQKAIVNAQKELEEMEKYV